MNYIPRIGDLVLYESLQGKSTLGIIKSIYIYPSDLENIHPDDFVGNLYRILWIAENHEVGYVIDRIREYRQNYLRWRDENGL
jgi:hypothetical protein